MQNSCWYDAPLSLKLCVTVFTLVKTYSRHYLPNERTDWQRGWALSYYLSSLSARGAVKSEEWLSSSEEGRKVGERERERERESLSNNNSPFC